MRRLLISVFTLIVVLTASAWFIWFFAYRLDPSPTNRDKVSGLRSETTIVWHPSGAAEVFVADSLDSYAAIGYAHGMRNTWTSLVLRQTALGRLGEWFGNDAVEIDIASRMLMLADDAEESFKHLDPASRLLLETYSNGMNAALENEAALRNENLVLLRIHEVDVWEPWHSIAVERLIAWLASSLEIDPAITPSTAPLDLVRLLQASTRMKEWLALEGFSNSTAWAVRRDDVTHLFFRLVYGSSITPYLQEFSFAVNNQPTLSALTFVGMPYMIAGKSDTKSWAVLPHQQVVVRQTDNLQAITARSRIAFADGTEQLIAFQRADDKLYFPGDSTDGVSVSWSGLVNATDADAWFRLVSHLQPSFSLLDGTSIEVSRNGAWTVDGPSTAVRKINGGVLLGHSQWSRFPAQRLAEWIEAGYPINIEALRNDTYSVWAEGLAPRLLEVAGDSTGDNEYDEAIQYLRNWDYTFSSSSIAGAIFDSWATQVWLTTGILPGLSGDTSIDSVNAIPALRSAIDRLRRSFGPDESGWRWELVQRNQRNWPLWLMMRKRSEAMATTRFSPINTIGSGHPSAIGWGATSNTSRGRPPGHWDAWLTSDEWTWSYTSDTNLNQYTRFRRTDAPLSTSVTEKLPQETIPNLVTSTRLRPR